ncbi:MAG: YegS/Rv2252/BmrU family lipid kinase [Anaerolineales bacterium]
MQNAYLLYNPRAGRVPAGWLLNRAMRVLGNAGWYIRSRKVQTAEELTAGAKEAAREGCEAVFVAGGDGSAGRVAAALAGTDTALGILPTGTANVWARELGLPRLSLLRLGALDRAAARLAQGEIRQIDLGLCDQRAFLLWAGIGLDGRIVGLMEPRSRLQKIFAWSCYVAIALWQAASWGGIKLRARALGKTWEGNYLAAVASNVRTYAGGLLRLVPGAKVDDGLLDFCLIEGRTLPDALLRVGQFLFGKNDMDGVTRFRAAEAAFEGEGELPGQVDGEPIAFNSPVRFAVTRRTLKVLVPQGRLPRVFSRDVLGTPVEAR